MPHPRTIPLTVSEQQQDTLQRLVHRETSPQRLVRRGKIILTAATGASNTKITQDLHVDCGASAGEQLSHVCKPLKPPESRSS